MEERRESRDKVKEVKLMINADSVVIISFDEQGQEQLKHTADTLDCLLNLFVKHGSFNDGEKTTLREARDLVNRIIAGETF